MAGTNSDLTKFELQISDFWPFRLNAAWLNVGLPTSHFWPLTSDSTSDFQLPTSNFWLLTSDFRLDPSVRLDCRSIRHAGINAQVQSSVERTAAAAVPFSPQKGTFLKSCSCKSNWTQSQSGNWWGSLGEPKPWFAWSQSGNNKTAQTLLSLFKKLSPRKEIRTPLKRLTFSSLSWNLLSHNAILHGWCSFISSCTSFLWLWICKSLSMTKTSCKEN